MGRYFDEMAAVIERHGGTVEKFIGDAVMAVFGIPRLHEDDAVRASRAAAGMRAALGTLNLELEREHGVGIAARIGVNTGRWWPATRLPDSVWSRATRSTSPPGWSRPPRRARSSSVRRPIGW